MNMTPSQRLRFALQRVYNDGKHDEPFEEWYAARIEGMINNVLKELEPPIESYAHDHIEKN